MVSRGPSRRPIAIALLFSAFFALIGLHAMAVAAPSPDATMAISGTVVDGTAGSKLPSNLKVFLEATDANQRPLPEESTSADPSGKFTFDQAPAGASSYVVAAEFSGVRYTAPVELKSGAASPVKLNVYEPTTSDAGLKLTNAYWVFASIDAANQQVTVLETLTLLNPGDHTYVGDHRGDPGSTAPGILPRTVRLPLPQGASDFAPASGLDPRAMLPMANGFVDTDPVTPGTHQIVYHYRMAFADGGVEILKSLPYPADHLIFLAPDQGLNLQSDRLGNGGTTQIDGKTYVVLGADNVPANQDVTVDVLGLPNPPTSRLSPETLRLVAIGAILPLLLAALALGIRASTRDRRDVASERHALLAAIARLDDLHQSGQLDQRPYAAERERQKQALALLLLRESVSPGVGNASPSGG